MGTNYSEQIFQSVDTIISQRLNEVSFDKTEICEIISIDEKIINKYLVSNGSLKYEAYSDDENRKYLVGSKVYVRINNGDYGLKKIITGSYTADEIPKNLYTNPFDHLVASSEISIPTSKLKVTAKKDGTETIESVTKSGLTFHYSGLGQFNYIGLDFSATTGFGGTIGEFQIIIDLLNSSGTSLLTNEQKGLLTFSSRQLYGNPYYLTSALHFQHLFNFPLEYNNVKFSDLTKVKKIKVTLRSLGNFNYPNTTTDISINSLKLYFGFDSTEDSMSENTVALVLDDPANNLEYSSPTNKKKMSIDWRNLTTNAIYNETENKQYPTAEECYVYWLQYSESIGYTKTLETSISDMSNIDIDESGTYWKTVQKEDASKVEAYTYTLSPCADWKKEQIKVIIKHKNGDYIESKGLTFTNKNFRSETGSNQGSKDTLRLSLAEGDDGVYNSYGIDNKLLTSYNLEHSLTVDYIDNTVWNKDLQKVIWKIPKNATMIKQPDGWSAQGNFYVLEVKHNTSNTDGKTIKFKLSDQFSYNKTNNTIYCEIIRYKDKNSGIVTDSYQGSITLQFGLQGTNGTGWSFNIISNQRALLNKGTGQNKMTLTATFEDSEGNPIADSNWVNKVKWSWYQTQYASEPQKRYSMSKTTGKTTVITRNDCVDCYAIIQAKLEDWQDKNGNKIDLVAYMPIAAGNPSYYLTGASRVVYNNAGTSPSYDEAPYVLYASNHTVVNAKDYTYSIISPETNKNKCFTINTTEGNLKPLSLLPTRVPKMALQVYDDKNKQASYIQPILVLKNGYQSKLLNEWNGTLTIDNTNNSIFSALMGAGVKNADNTFTGVLLGAIGKEITSAKTGIYGMQSGQLRYKLDENGNFYVGTGSDNRIDFSGTTDKTLTIEAKNFKLTTKKLTIDSNNGIKLLNSSNKTTIEFKNTGTATIGGWNIDTDRMYKSPTEDNGGTGLSATVHGGNPAFWAGYTGYGNNPWEHSKKRPEGDTTSWEEHTKCYITNNGVLHAAGAEIEGKFNINNKSTLNGTKVNKINGTTITSTPDSIALKAFEQKTTINGVTQTLNAHLKLNADNINAKVSKVNDGITETMSWNLTSGSFTVKANGTQVMKVTKDGMTLRGTLDIENGAKINGKVQPGNLNVAGIISAGSADIQGIVKATEISASKITTGTLNADLISGTNSNTITFNGNITVTGNATFYGNIKSGATIGAKGLKVLDSDYNTLLSRDNGEIYFGNDSIIGISSTAWIDIEATGFDNNNLGNDGIRLSGRRIYISGINSNTSINPTKYYLQRWYSSTNKNHFEIHANNDAYLDLNVGANNIRLWCDYSGGKLKGTWASDNDLSDNNIKHSIEEFDSEYDLLFDNLQPKKYKYNFGTSNRFHTGFIAQEVVEAIENSGLTTQDLAAVVFATNDPDYPEGIWSLRRDEFIALNTWQIQKLKTRVAELEKEIKEIKQNEI